MFKYLVLSFISIVIFTSCTTKNIDLLDKDSLYNQGLEYTKIKTIIKNNDIKGVLNITYLNPSYPKKFDKNYNEFLIGIYVDNYQNNYMMYLNDKRYISKHLVNKNTKIYKNIPVFNPHAIYYIVKFNKDGSSNLNLSFTHKQYEKLSISFKTF